MNLFGIKQYLIALFPLAIIVLVFPMALPGANFSTGQALLVALISAAMYGVFLLIQTKTHQSLFVYEHEDDGDDDDPHHGKPSAHSSAWHTVWLIVHLIAVIAVTKMNANPLETLLTELNAPVAFTGFLVALLILSPEGLGALKAVLNNQVQRAMNLFFGSVLATISLTVPVVTLIAFYDGQRAAVCAGRAGDDCDGRLVAAVPDFFLNRAHQRAERRGAYGVVYCVFNDNFCVAFLPSDASLAGPTGFVGRVSAAPPGNMPHKKPAEAGFFISCWYPVRRSSSPDRQSL